ncbi:MAG TPA: hypothetical protein VF388_10825, partial [Lacunisphaera sp.]
MKTTRRLIIFAGAVLAAASGWAQTVQFINVTRRANYVQTGTSSVSADTTTPFEFKAAVEGDNAMTGSTPLTAATYTKPGGSATSLTYDASGHHWVYRDDTQTSMANLNAAYTTGSYAFNLTGTPSGASSVSVSSFASTQLQVPMFTLSGGTWAGNTYQMAAGATLTVTFNALYSGTVGSTAAFHYDAELNGMGNQSSNAFINWDPTANSGAGAAATFTSTPPNFVANSLTAGSYTFEATFSDVQNPSMVYGGSVFAASLLEYR